MKREMEEMEDSSQHAALGETERRGGTDSERRGMWRKAEIQPCVFFRWDTTESDPERPNASMLKLSCSRCNAARAGQYLHNLLHDDKIKCFFFCIVL